MKRMNLFSICCSPVGGRVAGRERLGVGGARRPPQSSRFQSRLFLTNALERIDIHEIKDEVIALAMNLKSQPISV